MLMGKQIMLKGGLYLIVDLIQLENSLENIKEEIKSTNNINKIAILSPSKNSLFKVAIYNRYYNRLDITGNDLLAVIYYMYYNNNIIKNNFAIETDVGHKEVSLNFNKGSLEKIVFNMGKPVFTPRLVPIRSEKNIFVDETIQIEEVPFKTTCMSLGEPHAVVIDKDIDKIDLEYYGPKLEYHPIFFKRPNIEITEKFNDHFIYNRIWSKENHEIDYSISGACASVVALIMNNKLSMNKDILVISKGGLVNVNYNDEGIIVTSDARLNKLKVKQYND